MAVDITIPSPGESISEVSLSGWLKDDGTYVEKDDLLAEIESDKATLELRAPAAGTLRIATKKGEVNRIGNRQLPLAAHGTTHASINHCNPLGALAALAKASG